MGIVFVLLSLNVIFYLLWDNFRRAKRATTIPLRHNVLLNPYPLVFVGGKKSIFYFMAYWGDLPRFLAEHGYEIFNLDLRWQADQDHRNLLDQFLRDQSAKGTRLHLVIDASHAQMMEDLMRKNHYAAIRSCILIRQIDLPAPGENKSSASLRPTNHLNYEFYIPRQARGLIWRLHEWKTRSRAMLDLRKTFELSSKTREQFEQILDQVISISEKDIYSPDSTTGEKPHDHSANRPAGDLSSSQELS